MRIEELLAQSTNSGEYRRSLRALRKSFDQCLKDAGVNPGRVSWSPRVELGFGLFTQKAVDGEVAAFIQGKFPGRDIRVDKIEVGESSGSITVSPATTGGEMEKAKGLIHVPDLGQVRSNHIWLWLFDKGAVSGITAYTYAEALSGKKPQGFKDDAQELVDPVVISGLAKMLPDPEIPRGLFAWWRRPKGYDVVNKHTYQPIRTVSLEIR